ncbi:MAG: hypothetical protein COB37_00975 [Kordiimonadales bacterium]|nr:MAG: hypothetical protein COB37_00975 [Kordiimonadales bacterium]
MFKHYITTAFRVIIKNRLYSIVNLGGLSLGLAGAMLISLLINDETSYDTFWPGVEDIYRLNTTVTQADGTVRRTGQGAMLAKEALLANFPDEIIAASYTFEGLGRPITVDDKLFTARLSFVEQDFTKIYQLDYVEGSQETAVTGPNSAALSETSAYTYFGEGPYLGKTFRAASLGRDFVVTAVFKDVPTNSGHVLEVITEFQLEDWTEGMQAGMTGNWNYLLGEVNLRLAPGVDPRALEARFPAFLDRVATELPRFPDMKASEVFTYTLGNIRDVHLSQFSGFQSNAVSPALLWAIGALAVVIVGVACVNFVNLSLAQALKRQREVALRKVLGGARHQLITQYLGEAVALSLLALLAALVMVDFAMPWFETLVVHEISVDIYAPSSILAFTGLAVGLGLVAGLYPAVVLSSSRPSSILGGGRGSIGAGGKLNQVLVIFQFTVSIALIIATLVINRQISYSESLDTGFERDGLVSIVIGTGEGMFPNSEVFQQRLDNLPDVQMVSRARGLPVQSRLQKVEMIPTAFEATGPVEVGIMGAGYDYFSVLGVPIIAGREHGEAYGAEENTLVISQSAVKAFGYANADAAIGQALKLRGDTYTIVGVVGDLRLVSSKDVTPPMAYYVDLEFSFALTARVNTVSASTFTRDLGALWQEFYPDRTMTITYVDEALSGLYRRDKLTQEMLSTFSGLALFVSALGLFGLAAFNAERRTKEIGLRKVLGANVFGIVRLMIWQFSKPVLLANLIAWPLVYYFMDQWLKGFAERIDLSLWIFAAAGSAVLMLSWVTVMGHAVRVARRTPVTSLRHD